MVKTKTALGVGLIGFGGGMIFAVLLQTGLCAVILGMVFLIAGAVLSCGNGA